MPLDRLSRASLLDFGGVKFLAGWFRATYEHIRTERALVAMLDGDAAGDKERRDLGSYFGGHQVPWTANKQYVIVRAHYPIEGLFPDEWVVELNAEHPGWFTDFAIDASGLMQAFTFKDGNKRQAQQWLMKRSLLEENDDWRARWDAVLAALESALEWQEQKLRELSI
jgi:hypothetical protein